MTLEEFIRTISPSQWSDHWEAMGQLFEPDRDTVETALADITFGEAGADVAARAVVNDLEAADPTLHTQLIAIADGTWTPPE